MAEQFGDKTHDATPHRRQKAREEGQVAQSQDLASAIVLLGAVVGLMWLGESAAAGTLEFFSHHFGDTPELKMDVDGFVAESRLIFQFLAKTLLPFLGLMFVVAAAAHVLQIGLILAPQKLLPDASRISPLKGLQRLFSVTNGVKLALGLAKVGVVATVAAVSVWSRIDILMQLPELALRAQCAATVDFMLSTALHVAAALLILAILDYAYQKWKFEQDLKMTTQEVRDEYKNLQGDPQVIARRKQVQRQLAQSRLKSTVPEADVVITNPTELAIALRYDSETMEAPLVIAKGAGVIAAQIRRLALENGIPILERKPLARALYAQVEVNQQIPADHYAAVAEVLKYVYELKGDSGPTRRTRRSA